MVDGVALTVYDSYMLIAYLLCVLSWSYVAIVLGLLVHQRGIGLAAEDIAAFIDFAADNLIDGLAAFGEAGMSLLRGDQ